MKRQDLAIKFGENGRKRVEEMFSWESIAKKTYEMYKDVIEKYKK